MKLIEQIEIEGFRSIRSDKLPGLGDFTAFAGLNNGGKSNVLRAFNAFFNGQTDVGTVVNVDADYFRPELRKRRKAKRIKITVTFSLPTQFKFHHGLKAVGNLLSARTFRVTKEWRRNEPLPAYHLNDGPELGLDDRTKIDQFLQLINFRYIPNRVLPTAVIQNEHQSLRDVLIRRLGKKAKGHNLAFDAIRETSDKLIASLASRFKTACPTAGDVRLATPGSWKDMLFAFGYRLSQGDVEIEDSAQGSGIQSLLMLETLYLIDRDYFQKFGWRQAAIWAVEEPESSLHSSLEARVASYLATISADPTSRLQIFCTTHSDLMLQLANKVIAVEQENGQTSFRPMAGPREALEYLSRVGVSRFSHPLLHYPLDPLILLEGKYDYAFIEEAIKILRPTKRVRIAFLEQLATGGQTGGSELFPYIKDNALTIKNRAKDSPVVLLLDWDAKGKRESFQKHFGPDDPFKVLVWPDSAFNPLLGRSFRGIERHFSDRLVNEVEAKGVKVYRAKDGTCSVDRDDYGNTKQKLYEIVKLGLQANDLQHAKPFIEEVLRIAGSAA